MKEVIKMLSAIEKDLVRVIKYLNKMAVSVSAKAHKKKGSAGKGEKIRELLAKGKKVTDIAAKLGVGASTVYSIKAKMKKEQK